MACDYISHKQRVACLILNAARRIEQDKIDFCLSIQVSKINFYICYIRFKQSRGLYSKICQIKIFGVAFLALNARRENKVLILYDNITLFYIPLLYTYSLK